MTAGITDVSILDQYLAVPVPAGYPTDRRRMFVTVDQVQAAIYAAVAATRISQVVAVYSFDEEPMVAQLVANYHSIPDGLPTLIVQDRSCYETSEGTRVSAPLVALRGQPNFRWSVGTSDRGEIMHMKSAALDGLLCITGSTNWSKSGECEEDNECEFALNTALATQLTARIEQIYRWQMAHCPQPR